MTGPAPGRLAVIVWLACLVVAGWMALFRTPMATEITRLLPDAGNTATRLAVLQETAAARLILLAIEGGDEAARTDGSRRLAAALAADGRFLRVANGGSRINAEALRPVFEGRYLLSPAVDADRFSEAGLRQALTDRLRALRSPLSPAERELLPRDPTGEMLTIARAWQAEVRAPRLADGVWVSADGARALLLIETAASGFDPKAQGPLIDAIQAAFASVSGDAGLRLRISGPGALATLSERLIRADAGLLGALSLAAIVLILALAYRSLPAVLLSPLPLISAVVVATALVGLVFGDIHGLTLGFGATLLGVCVDYPVHLFSHRHRAETAAATIRRIWPTMRLCAATTAIGYGAMLSSSFTGLAQLGVFSIAGLLTAALVTRFVLPVLLPGDWVPLVAGSGPAAWAAGLLRRRARVGPWGWIVCIALLFAACLSMALHPPRWETDLAAINPVPAAVLAADAALRADLGAPEAGQMLFIDAPDTDRALELSEAVSDRLAAPVAAGALSGFEAASRYLPSARRQRERQQGLPSPQELRQALVAAAAGLPFRTEAFAPFLADVERARHQPPLTRDDLAGTPVASRLAALLVPRPHGVTALVLLTGVRDPEQVRAAVAPLAGDGVSFVDFRAETNRTMAAFRDTSLLRLAAGAALLMAFLVIAVGDVGRAATVLIPMTAAVAVDVSILALQGERLNPFHLVSLLLVVGIGIDYGLFLSRGGETEDAETRTLHALVVCSSSTAAGFLVLCLSSLPALNAIGRTVAVGVVVAFALAALIARPRTARLAEPTRLPANDER